MSSVEPLYPNAKSKTAYQDGLEFQDFVCAQLAKHAVVLQNLASKRYQFEVGENLQGFEIKLDNYACGCLKHTNETTCSVAKIEREGQELVRAARLSIEVYEKSRDSDDLPWTPSGILRNDNTWLYIQGNYKILYVFAKRFLLNYYERKREIQGFVTEKHGTIKTFYLPNADARKHAAKVLEF